MKSREIGTSGVAIPAIGLECMGMSAAYRAAAMNELTAVRGALDRLPAGALGPLVDLLAEDVEFEVSSGGDAPECRKDWGKRAVLDYFAALGGLVEFWRMDYSALGGRVIAWGDESFTVEGSGLEGGTEFALVFDVREDLVTRLLVIEDLSSIPGWDFPAGTVAGGRSRGGRGVGAVADAPLRARHRGSVHLGPGRRAAFRDVGGAGASG